MELNRLEVVLVENKHKGKWLGEILGKNEATVSDLGNTHHFLHTLGNVELIVYSNV
jgi:hypothetical protein